jgi:uncharacterized membrane protein
MDLSANKADAGTMNLLVSQEDFRLVYRQVNEVADVVIKGLEQLYALALAVELDKRFVDEENEELRAELADLQEQVDEMEMMIDFVRDECAAKCGGEDGKKSGAVDDPPRD